MQQKYRQYISCSGSRRGAISRSVFGDRWRRRLSARPTKGVLVFPGTKVFHHQACSEFICLSQNEEIPSEMHLYDPDTVFPKMNQIQ